MAFHVEVNFSGFPFVAGFGQEGRDEPQEGGFIGEDAGDAGAPFEFLIHAFQPVGGAQSFLVGEGQGKDGQALGQVFLHPAGQFRGAFGVVGDDFLEAGFGGGAAGGDFAGGNALDIHFGHGEFEGLLGANAFFQGAGIEGGFAADLRDAKGDGAHPAGEGFGLVAVGVTQAGVGAFVRLGLKDLMAFDTHGFIDENAQAFGEAVVALFSQQLQDVVQQFRIGVVGHVWFVVGCVWLHPNRKPTWPALDQFFARGAASPLRGSAALGSLRSPSLRLTTQGWRRREEGQFTERVLHRHISCPRNLSVVSDSWGGSGNISIDAGYPSRERGCLADQPGKMRENRFAGEIWRRGRDSNPRDPCEPSGFQDRRIRPLCHLSTIVNQQLTANRLFMS